MRSEQQRSIAVWVLLGLTLAGVGVGGLWVRAGIDRQAAVMFVAVVALTVAAGAAPLPFSAERG